MGTETREDPNFTRDFEQLLPEHLDYAALTRTVQSGIESALEHPWLENARRLVLTGSGDSLFAARSALPAIRRWSGLPAEAMTSLEFARYEAPILDRGDVLVAISNSGGSSRTRETILLARDRGIPTLGVTGAADGPVARRADCVIHRPVRGQENPDVNHGRAVVHMAEYLATLVALYRFAQAFGVRRGRIDDGEHREVLAAIDRAIDSVPPIARAAEPSAVALAKDLHERDADTIWVLGAGPNRGTAEYCAAKFHEQIPLNGVPQDLEEWAHLQYFLTLRWGERSVALVLAAPGNARDRADEIVAGIWEAGGCAVAIAPPGQSPPGASWTLDVTTQLDELLTPLVYHLPAQLLVLHLARLAKVEPTPLRRRDDYRLIRHGAVLDGVQGLK